MKKQMIAMCLAGSMALSLCACGNKEPENSPASTMIESENAQGTDISEENDVKSEETSSSKEEVFSFSEFKNLQFTFYSGAGGWGTLMKIDSDGSFSGEYFDGELGDTEEDYPNGTTYQCHFAGTFTEPVKVNDYTYSMRIQDIHYEKEPGTQEIINGMRFCYTKPNGLENPEDILIYTPGAPLAELPEYYRLWVGYSEPMMEQTGDTELPFFGLYNEKEEFGFASHNIIDAAKEIVANEAEWAASLEESLENDNFNQAEMNETSLQIYNAWDYALNSVWKTLKETLDEDAMEALTIEEREWIQMKEQAVMEAGAEVEGGSMYPLVTNMKAAELTKTRVYELLELLE